MGLHAVTSPTRTLHHCGIPTGHSLLLGSFISAGSLCCPVDLHGLQGHGCLIVVCPMGCMRISASVPEALALPPPALTLVSPELFHIFSLLPSLAADAFSPLLKYVPTEALITISDCLSLGQQCICLGSSWHCLCQIQGKTESSWRSHSYSPPPWPPKACHVNPIHMVIGSLDSRHADFGNGCSTTAGISSALFPLAVTSVFWCCGNMCSLKY